MHGRGDRRRGAVVAPHRPTAQDWARKMFDKTTHDFGVVARGAKAEYRFVIENIYEEDAHIKSVHVELASARSRRSPSSC